MRPHRAELDLPGSDKVFSRYEASRRSAVTAESFTVMPTDTCRDSAKPLLHNWLNTKLSCARRCGRPSAQTSKHRHRCCGAVGRRPPKTTRKVNAIRNDRAIAPNFSQFRGTTSSTQALLINSSKIKKSHSNNIQTAS